MNYLRKIITLFFITGLLLSGVSLFSQNVQKPISSYQIAAEIIHNSWELTRLVRTYAVTGKQKYLIQYRDLINWQAGNSPRPAYVGLYAGERISQIDIMYELDFHKMEFDLFHRALENLNNFVLTEEQAIKSIKEGRITEGLHNALEGETPRDFAIRILFNEKYHSEISGFYTDLHLFLKMIDIRIRENIGREDDLKFYNLYILADEFRQNILHKTRLVRTFTITGNQKYLDEYDGVDDCFIYGKKNRPSSSLLYPGEEQNIYYIMDELGFSELDIDLPDLERNLEETEFLAIDVIVTGVVLPEDIQPLEGEALKAFAERILFNDKYHESLLLELEKVDHFMNSALVQLNRGPVRLKFDRELIKAVHAENSIEDVQMLLDSGADVNCHNRDGYTPLLYALMNDQREMCHFLLDRGADVNAQSKSGITTLRLAVQDRGNQRIIKRLLNGGADVNAPDGDGDTPLMIALILNDNNLDDVKLLLDAGADVMIRNDDGLRAVDYLNFNDSDELRELLKLLTRRGDLAVSPNTYDFIELFKDDPSFETARIFLEAGGDPHAFSGRNLTPFSAVCVYGADPAIIKLFLDHGAEANQQYEEEYTPILLVSYGNTPDCEVYRLLIEGGADVNDCDENGFTPLLYNMIPWGSAEFLQLLYEEKINEEELLRKIAEEEDRKIENIDILLKAGANVNSRNSMGESPLLLAVKSNLKLESLNRLLDGGAEINSVNNKGTTALMIAAKNTNSLMIEFLLDKGADVFIEDNNGKNLWHFVQKYELTYGVLLYNRIKSLFGDSGVFTETVSAEELFEIMEYISINPQTIMNYIKSGGDVNILNKNGDSFLLLSAVTAENPLVFDFLIKAGALVDSRDINDSTPLLLASANRKNGEIIKLLLQAGADVNARNMAGMTPLIAAIYNSSDSCEFVQLLIDGGAILNIVDNNGMTPLLLALSRSKEPEVIKLLIDENVINKQEKNGWNPIMVAAGNEYSRIEEVISLLLDAGANPHIKNTNGFSAIDLMRDNAIFNNTELYYKLINND